MNVIVLNINKVDNESNIRAYAEVLIANTLRIKDIKLFESKDKDRYFIGMPSRKRTIKGEELYEDIVEIMNRDFKHEVARTIVEAYNAQNPVTIPAADHETAPAASYE